MDPTNKEMSQSTGESQNEVGIEARIQKLKESLARKSFFNFKLEVDDRNIMESLPQLESASSSQYSKVNQQVESVFADINILSERKLIDIRSIYEVMATGIVFEVIVLRKDVKSRNLVVFLNKFHSICDQCNLTNMKEEDIKNFRDKKEFLEELKFIHLYKIHAVIKESELIEFFSIFSSDFNFNTISEGDELFAVITKNDIFGLSEQEQREKINGGGEIQNLIQMSCKNEILQNSKFLSIQNILDPKTYDPNADLFVRLGAKPDNNVKITKEDIKYFEQYGIYPYDLQIRRCTSMKNISNRQNMIRSLRLRENDSLNGHYTNKNLISEIQIDYKRKQLNSSHILLFLPQRNEQIRELQNIKWASQALDEAQKLIKENMHQQALQYLNTAQDFDPYMPQIYLTRGCALANLGRYKEGVIELRKSLSLNPDDDITKKYLEKVMKKYEEEQKFLYTKQAKHLTFDKQKLEMKNNAALNFNAQDNSYKFVSEAQYEMKAQNSLFSNHNEQMMQTQMPNQNFTNKLSHSQLTQLIELNSKKSMEQQQQQQQQQQSQQQQQQQLMLQKKEPKSSLHSRSSSSSSSDRKKKKKKDKKIKKDKKEKKEKKNKSKS